MFRQLEKELLCLNCLVKTKLPRNMSYGQVAAKHRRECRAKKLFDWGHLSAIEIKKALGIERHIDMDSSLHLGSATPNFQLAGCLPFEEPIELGSDGGANTCRRRPWPTSEAVPAPNRMRFRHAQIVRDLAVGRVPLRP